MKKKQLIKTDKPKETNVAKPLCGSYGGQSCTANFGAGEETDILL